MPSPSREPSRGESPRAEAQRASRPWWNTSTGDVTLAVAYAGIVALGIAAGYVNQPLLSWMVPGGVPRAHLAGPLVFAACVPGLVGVALRHRSPRTAFALIALGTLASAASGNVMGTWLLVFEFFFSLTLLGSPLARRLTTWAAASITVVLVAMAWGGPGGLETAFFVAAICALSMGLAITWANDLRRADQLRTAEAQRADAAEAAAKAQAELALRRERAHMASELHDTVSGHLSAIALQSQAALLAAPERVEPILREIRANSVASLEQMQGFIRLLAADAPQPAPTGSLADLPALAARAEHAGHAVRLSVPPVPPRVDDAGAAALYRAASEAVTNAMKHAPGSAIDLTLDDDGGLARVRVVSTGRANAADASKRPADGAAGLPAAAAGTGLGLRQLRERLAHAGGALDVRADGQRWSVEATVLLTAETTGPTEPAEPAGERGTP